MHISCEYNFVIFLKVKRYDFSPKKKSKKMMMTSYDDTHNLCVKIYEKFFQKNIKSFDKKLR
jgi:hypothetical protein